MIRGTLALLAICVFAGLASAQSNEEKYKKKLTKEFVSKVEWVQTLEEAKKQAAEQNKLIFGYFTRSYSP